MPDQYSMQTIDQFVGETVGVSDWLTIDQASINAFADATGDHQWIHVDEAKAAASPIGSTVAHGYFTLSLLSKMLGEIGVVPGDVQYVLNYGSDKVRYINFVRVDSRVRVVAELISAERRPLGTMLKVRATMEIEGEAKPAMVAEVLLLAVGV